MITSLQLSIEEAAAIQMIWPDLARPVLLHVDDVVEEDAASGLRSLVLRGVIRHEDGDLSSLDPDVSGFLDSVSSLHIRVTADFIGVDEFGSVSWSSDGQASLLHTVGDFGIHSLVKGTHQEFVEAVGAFCAGTVQARSDREDAPVSDSELDEGVQRLLESGNRPEGGLDLRGLLSITAERNEELMAAIDLVRIGDDGWVTCRAAEGAVNAVLTGDFDLPLTELIPA